LKGSSLTFYLAGRTESKQNEVVARKWRIEYSGAVYHVINRGNYRAWVFREEGAREAFEACLYEAAERYGWIVHAWVVMGNHFHLAVATPDGNLVAGMQWLQSVYANRFNRYRGENGQLFQGRYQALLVEPGDALGMVCHYIHLNPVRAQILPVEQLPAYRHGSYRLLFAPGERPRFLQVNAFLVQAGSLADTPAGWAAYQSYLSWQATEGPAGRNAAYARMSKGWALGTAEFKDSLLLQHLTDPNHRAWSVSAATEEREMRWRAALKTALKTLGRQTTEAAAALKSADWKVAIAAYLKRTLGVPNAWLAEALQMGSGFYVSKHVGLARRPDHPVHKLIKRLEVKGKR
jgi:putative transposase